MDNEEDRKAWLKQMEFCALINEGLRIDPEMVYEHYPQFRPKEKTPEELRDEYLEDYYKKKKQRKIDRKNRMIRKLQSLISQCDGR